MTTAQFYKAWQIRSVGRTIPSLLYAAAIVGGGVSATDAHGADLGLPISSTFQQLCEQPGVVRCVGFDDPANISEDLIPSSSGIYPEVDNSIQASGGGSLRYVVPPLTGANSSGAYHGDFRAQFGQGESFYVAFKQRFSKEMVETDFGGGNGWKQMILHSKGKSCAAIEITMQNTYHRGFPQMYSRCGADNFTVSLPNHDYLLQQGDYQCHYQDINSADCSMYKPDQWITFYLEIHVGNWGEPDSAVSAYIAYEDQALEQFIKIENYELFYNDDPSDTFNTIQLTPYNTNKSSSDDHPPAYVWYDDLVISRERIFQVSDANIVKPEPPTQVEAN